MTYGLNVTQDTIINTSVILPNKPDWLHNSKNYYTYRKIIKKDINIPARLQENCDLNTEYNRLIKILIEVKTTSSEKRRTKVTWQGHHSQNRLIC